MKSPVKYPKNVLIITHMYEKGGKGGLPQEEIRNFLKSRCETVTYLELPFHYAKIRCAYITEFYKGNKIKQLNTTTIKGPQWIQYIIHILIIYYFLIKLGFKYELCIAMDNLGGLPIIPLRKIHLIKRLLYYSIDYTPIRFDNKMLNLFYQLTNKITSRNADLNWAVSEAICNEKRKRGILGNNMCLVVPVGFRKQDIVLPDYKKIDKYHLVYVGILLEKQGLQLVLRAMPELIKRNSKIRLTIIGTGEYRDILIKLASNLNISKQVKFTGFIKDTKKVEKILSRSGIGLATYKPMKESFTKYADPGKIKLYLGCGLPIITTGVPEISRDIKRNGAGKVIKYNSKNLANAIYNIIGSHKKYRNAALKMSENFDYEKIYSHAFRTSNDVIVP